MKAPLFWKEKNNISAFLRPLGSFYSAFLKKRNALIKPYKAPVPILCVGNLTLGGGGKTPTVIALFKALAPFYQKIVCVSRGYGGSLKGPLKVDLNHKAADVGDEPLLLARHLEVWVGKNRNEAVDAAILDGATLILLDDGFQNVSLQKDVNLVVIDSHAGIGNGLVFPAGPLRESLHEGLLRADAFLLIGENIPPLLQKEPLFKAKPLFKSMPKLHAPALLGPVIAFAGLALPEKFFKGLGDLSLDVIQTHAFRDHHAYKKEELDFLLRKAAKKGATLLTTEKDYVKLTPFYQEKIEVCPYETTLPEEIIPFLKEALRGKRMTSTKQI